MSVSLQRAGALLLAFAVLILPLAAKCGADDDLRKWTQLEPHATIKEARDALATFSSSLMGHMLNDDHEPRDLARFDRWKVTGSCPANRPLTKYGGIISRHPMRGRIEDGHKYFCDVGIPEFQGPQANCLILSLGSNGDYSFERFMLNATDCHVHTFDCTFNGKSQMPGRHTYHQVCLGPDTAAQTNTASTAESARRTGNAKPVYKSWATISAELNPGGHKRIAVLKCDIEGGEFSMVAGLNAAAGQALPEQLAIEVHLTDAWKVTLWHVHALHAHLAHLGYALVSRDDNPYSSEGQSVTEYAWLNVASRQHRSRVVHGSDGP